MKVELSPATCSEPVGAGMLDRHGSGFIRHLGVHLVCCCWFRECVLSGKLLGAEAVYRAFAEIVVSIDDISFNQKFIQVINELLLTAVEYRSLQEILRRGLQNPHCRELFNVLYPSWCATTVSDTATTKDKETVRETVQETVRETELAQSTECGCIAVLMGHHAAGATMLWLL